MKGKGEKADEDHSEHRLATIDDSILHVWEASNNKNFMARSESRSFVLFLSIEGLLLNNLDVWVFFIGSRYQFFGWYDPEMCQRSMDTIPGLLRSKNELEAKLKASKQESKRMRGYLIPSNIFIEKV
ncbi:hypothetical protein R6Q57_024930 [Mikania cordata]